jgi:hypothetical protein
MDLDAALVPDDPAKKELLLDFDHGPRAIRFERGVTPHAQRNAGNLPFHQSGIVLGMLEKFNGSPVEMNGGFEWGHDKLSIAGRMVAER